MTTFLGLFFPIRFQEALRHLLDAGVGMRIQPHCRGDVIGQFTMIDRPIVTFANIVETQDAGLRIDCSFRVIASARRRYGKTDRIPLTLWRSPAATAGVAKIAERLEDVLRGSLIFMSRSRTVAVPATAQRQ